MNACRESIFVFFSKFQAVSILPHLPIAPLVVATVPAMLSSTCRAPPNLHAALPEPSTESYSWGRVPPCAIPTTARTILSGPQRRAYLTNRVTSCGKHA